MPKRPESPYAEAAEWSWFRLVSVRRESPPQDLAAQNADVISGLAAKFAQLPPSRLWIEFSLTPNECRKAIYIVPVISKNLNELVQESYGELPLFAGAELAECWATHIELLFDDDRAKQLTLQVLRTPPPKPAFCARSLPLAENLAQDMERGTFRRDFHIFLIFDDEVEYTKRTWAIVY